MNTKTKVLLTFIALFLAGFASGSLFSSVVSEPGSEQMELGSEQQEAEQDQWERDDRRERGQSRGERARSRLAGLLELTNEQQTPFFEYMSEYRSTLRSEISEMRSRENEIIQEHYQSFRKDLSNFLNTEQLEKLDSHLHPDSLTHQRSRGRGQVER